jgi:hypothetical protein
LVGGAPGKPGSIFGHLQEGTRQAIGRLVPVHCQPDDVMTDELNTLDVWAGRSSGIERLGPHDNQEVSDVRSVITTVGRLEKR